MILYTIGSTQKSAEQFFAQLEAAGVKRVIDVRLSNTGQLAGFTKRDDLRFFLRRIGGIDYVEYPQLAPTRELRDRYRRDGDFEAYARGYLALLRERGVEKALDRTLFDSACLLCSEPVADRCHRRVAADHLAAQWGGVTVVHL